MVKKPKSKKIGTRFCTPFTIKCTNCSEYIFKNKRHNTNQEEVIGGDYYGVKVYRFLFKCTGCKNTLSIKTDPKNGEYLVENGCIKVEDFNKKTRILKSESSNISDKIKNIDKLKQDIKNLYEIEKNQKTNEK